MCFNVGITPFYHVCLGAGLRTMLCYGTSVTHVHHLYVLRRRYSHFFQMGVNNQKSLETFHFKGFQYNSPPKQARQSLRLPGQESPFWALGLSVPFLTALGLNSGCLCQLVCSATASLTSLSRKGYGWTRHLLEVLSFWLC